MYPIHPSSSIYQVYMRIIIYTILNCTYADKWMYVEEKKYYYIYPGRYRLCVQCC